ncbi:flagellar biosynthesis sigma factor [Paraburkholderia sp. RL17-337-BIB-A]|uniref:flagellar biosynthesis sigma factor n=1 Tax=Paraburkholderia sp. RL17-337-BIB-A TaxID=3031636 RepID=UPI0038BC451D
MTSPVDEVVLTLGEPYEQVRKQSRSTLPAGDPGIFWGGFVTRPARLRFTDPEHGFVTPPAKLLYVGTGEFGKVESATLSPQIETLPLDKAMVIVEDLQEQLQRRGWHPIRAQRFPPITSTPTMVESIRRGDDPQSFWQVAGKYQVALDIRRFVHESRPQDERYLITVELSGPPLMEAYPGD